MKKIAFTVIALLGLGTASFAQNSYDGVRPTTNRSQDLPRNRVLADNGVDSPFLRRFGFGVKVGLNVSSMSDLDDSNSKPGFTAGVFQHEIDHLNGILFIDRTPDRAAGNRRHKSSKP